MNPSSESMPSETLTLVERRDEYPGIATYIFQPANKVAFVAGSYAHIRVLSLPERARRVRELSFASAPEDAVIWFGVDGRSGSDYQRALQELKPGDTVELFKIRSHITWPPPVADMVMIAGGVGVTPFRSMLRDLRQKELSIHSTLLAVASSSFLYEEELRDLAGKYLPLSRTQLPEALDATVAEHPDAHYYLAGSKGFVEMVVGELQAKGIKRIESDEFKGLSDIGTVLRHVGEDAIGTAART